MPKCVIKVIEIIVFQDLSSAVCPSSAGQFIGLSFLIYRVNFN